MTSEIKDLMLIDDGNNEMLDDACSGVRWTDSEKWESNIFECGNFE